MAEDNNSILAPVDGDPFNEATVTSQTDSPLRATWDQYAGRFNDWLSAAGQDPGPDHVPGTFVGWPQAINRAVGINGPRQGVVSDVANRIDRNMISGPLAEAQKFGQDPQASAAASPVAQAFKEIAQGGTGDPERDARNQELATGFGSQAAGWMALPGLGRAATMADPGLGTIGGRVGARAFPKAEAALTQAEQHEAMGVPNNDIYNLTGWRRGKEGTWEFEIPDRGLTTKAYDPAVHGTSNSRQAFKLSDLISHPLLERAYPDIAQNATVVFDPQLEGRSSAHAYVDVPSGTLAIALGKPTGILPGQQFPKEMIGSLLHEVGHGISEIAEGRSPGGSPQVVARKVAQNLHTQGYGDSEINHAVWEYYRSLGDETRQRVVQERFLNPDKTASEPYYQTAARMGYPEEHQIIPPQAAAPGDFLGQRREAGTIIDQMKSAGILAPKPVREILQGQMEKTNPNSPDNLRSSIDVWHGSPHDFDQFDTSKIGTGEGAQAYGHGLYFADHPEVAQVYKNRPMGPVADNLTAAEDLQYKDLESQAQRLIDRTYRANPKGWTEGDAKYRGRVANLIDQDTAYQQLRDRQKALLDKGGLYRARINAEPEHFLDWDKPLSEQSEHVKGALRPFMKELEARAQDTTNISNASELPGEAIYGTLRMAKNPRYTNDADWQRTAGHVSQALRDADIAGIRYLDQGSRGKGEGTHNYVVFDDKIVQVLEKNGKPVKGKVVGMSGAPLPAHSDDEDQRWHPTLQRVDHNPFQAHP